MSSHPVLPALALDLPMLPLRDVVIFPHMVIPLFVGRQKHQSPRAGHGCRAAHYAGCTENGGQ